MDRPREAGNGRNHYKLAQPVNYPANEQDVL